MIRYTFLALAAIGTAAAAIAAGQPARPAVAEANVTIVYKNDVFPVLGPVTVEACAVEDCSEVIVTGLSGGDARQAGTQSGEFRHSPLS